MLFLFLLFAKNMLAQSDSSVHLKTNDIKSSAAINLNEKDTTLELLVDGFAKLIRVNSKGAGKEVYYIVKMHGTKPLELFRSTYSGDGQKKLSELFSDDIELAEKIMKGKMKFDELKLIVSEYNTWRIKLDRMTNETK